MAQMVKNLPTIQEIWVWFMGQEDPLENRMATCSSILALSIPWREEHGELYSPWGDKDSDMMEGLTLSLSHWFITVIS